MDNEAWLRGFWVGMTGGGWGWQVSGPELELGDPRRAELNTGFVSGFTEMKGERE